MVVAAIERFLTGHSYQSPPERVLATGLFTDLVASTERLTELGDRGWGELLDAHDSTCDRELERFRGRRVKSTGDGLLAVFDGPARAIRCAAAILHELAGLGLDVRAGLHTGECDRRGEDTGIAVNIAVGSWRSPALGRSALAHRQRLDRWLADRARRSRRA